MQIIFFQTKIIAILTDIPVITKKKKALFQGRLQFRIAL